MWLHVLFAVSATAVYRETSRPKCFHNDVCLGDFGIICSGKTGLHISTCGVRRRVDADETGRFTLRCTPSWHRNMKWTLERRNGHELEIARCFQIPPQCFAVSVDYTAILGYVNGSLTVRQNHRNRIAGKVRCHSPDDNYISSEIDNKSDFCNVRVVYPAQKVSNCRTEVDTSNWTVFGSCDVDKIYASDDQYSCQWTFNGRITTKHNGTFSLTNFTEDNKAFKRGTCSFSGLPMPTFDDIYPVSLTINPGNKTFHGQNLEISHPGAPTFHDCPKDITEGEDLNCTCQPSDSSPPALVTWSSGSTLSGQPWVQNVSMKHNGMKYTCTQSWGGCLRKHISYTMRVKRQNNHDGGHDDVDGGGGDGPGKAAAVADEDGQSMLIAEVSVVVIVVAFVIIAAVLILFKKCDSRYANPKRTDPTEDSHIYSDLASLPESSADRPVSCASGYDNTAFHQPQEHVDQQPAEYVKATSETQPASDESQYENTITNAQPASPENEYENSLRQQAQDADGGDYEITD